MFKKKHADICLVLEGTYPHVTGGVSNWTHNLIKSLPEYSFALVCIQPKDMALKLKYDVPDNVISTDIIHLHDLEHGASSTRDAEAFFEDLKPLLLAIQSGAGDLGDLEAMIDLLGQHHNLGYDVLLNSEAAWDMLSRMYEETQPESSFIDFFWSWRALLGGLLTVLLAEVPSARIYHCISTGFAGLYAARAGIEKERPVILTEHGIYTNERQIEINSADWLYDSAPTDLSVDGGHRDLRDVWMQSFASYSRICYQACHRIYTLYGDNQIPQIEGGASPTKLEIIPNGIELERYANIELKADTVPTIALIGRVVPIKDVKTFIRACKMITKHIPNLNALIMGPADEDPVYFEECESLVKQLGLEGVITFTGMVNIDDYLPTIDLLVMTSISEAQPLVILEAGAAGIPTVATNVGACREMIMGQVDEDPMLGAGGAITALATPSDTARKVAELLTNQEAYHAASQAIKARVKTYYSMERQIDSYRAVYKRNMDVT